MLEAPHPPVDRPPPPAPIPLRARRIVGGCSFAAAVVGGTIIVRTLAVLTIGAGLPGSRVVTSAFVFGLFVAAPAFLGFLGATDVLPLFPRREEGVFARWSALAGVGAGAMSGAVWTIAEGILGGRGLGLLIALLGAIAFGWISTQMLVGHAIRVELLHPLSRTGKCAQCGYDLRATRAGRCPECGTRVR